MAVRQKLLRSLNRRRTVTAAVVGTALALAAANALGGGGRQGDVDCPSFAARFDEAKVVMRICGMFPAPAVGVTIVIRYDLDLHLTLESTVGRK